MKKIFIAGAFILFAVITNAQNVGIGKPNPQAKLEIKQTNNLEPTLLLSDSTEGSAGRLRFRSLLSEYSNRSWYTDYKVATHSKNNEMFLYNDSTNVMNIYGTGNITIGDGVAPNARLTIYSDNPSSDMLNIFGSTQALKILGNGNVGIGTTNPAAKLEVAGNVKVNGKISNVTDPVAAQDAATKNYVDQMAEILLDAGLNGVVVDIDGNAYKTIKIDTQVWMAQNLRTTRYNDGTVIPKVTDNTAWAALTTPAYCWYNADSTLNAKIYGALYNYYTVADTNSLNVCPTGWHVPSDAEWTVLSDFLTAKGYGFGGSGADIGKSMASTFRWTSSGTAGHIGNDQGTNNSSGFAGLPGGYRYGDDGTFYSIGSLGSWWSSSEVDTFSVWIRDLNYFNDDLSSGFTNKLRGFSVRCLRD